MKDRSTINPAILKTAVAKNKFVTCFAGVLTPFVAAAFKPQVPTLTLSSSLPFSFGQGLRYLQVCRAVSPLKRFSIPKDGARKQLRSCRVAASRRWHLRFYVASFAPSKRHPCHAPFKCDGLLMPAGNPCILLPLFRHQFSTYQQQDAHEFLLAVLDQTHEEVMGIFGSPKDIAGPQAYTTPSPVQRNFEGAITHELTCTQCGNVTLCVELFYVLSLSLPPEGTVKGLSTQELFDSFFSISNQAWHSSLPLTN